MNKHGGDNTRQLALDWSREDKVASAIERDKAIANVERGSGEWQVDALAAIRSLAASKSEFTTDDVWRALGRDPSVEGRAMGAAMRSGAKLGLVARTERTAKSHRVACHRRDLRVWRSLIYKGGPT